METLFNNFLNQKKKKILINICNSLEENDVTSVLVCESNYLQEGAWDCWRNAPRGG